MPASTGRSSSCGSTGWALPDDDRAQPVEGAGQPDPAATWQLPRISASAGALMITVGLAAATVRHMITLAAVVACALLAGLAVFQVLLVAGRPLGRFAWGGQHEVLPRTLRASSAVSVVLYAAIAWFVWRAAAEPEAAGPWIWVLTAFFALGVGMNAASRSRPERLVMTPVALVLAVSCLLIALG